MAQHKVAQLSELSDDTALRVDVAGKPVCVARSGGSVYAIGDLCSHADVSLSEGDVEDGKIECWLHGSLFDLKTGQPSGLPAVKPVPTYAVTIEGDDVLVELEP